MARIRVFLDGIRHATNVEDENCDAKRPCSTCVRSYHHAKTHAPAGTIHPPEPECTFDETPEVSTTGNDAPKTKYEKLEYRIAELEELLRQKESMMHTNEQSPDLSLGSQPPENRSISQSASPGLASSVSSSARGDNNSISPGSSSSAPLLSGSSSLDVLWSNWPEGLPDPELLQHLVDVFFTFHPHAGRLFHSATFMASLRLPPTHARFPATPVLHAICAVGSLYTAVVTSPPPLNFDEVDPEELFFQKYREKENRPDSFAEHQARLAKETAHRLEFLGVDLFQVLQANIILCWYYCSHANLAELFMNCGHCLRLSLPLGLNVCPPFHTISKVTRPVSLVPAAKTVIDDETRRNTFWLAYSLERQHGCSNGWALSLDDQDVSQLLPVQDGQFNTGVLVSPHERQWAHDRNLLVVHPASQVDPFVLYIKATILLSKVKTFNMRFRARHFSGEEVIAVPHPLNGDSGDPIDPRSSKAFIELDCVTTSFISLSPAHLRTPIQKNVVDCTLFSTILMSHVATLVLHEPHADVKRAGCISALKILTAARSIIDLVYAVWSTSFDISLFASITSFYFYTAGRVLIRFLQAAVEQNVEDQISTLQSELSILKMACEQMGQRHRIARSFSRMLHEMSLKAQNGQGEPISVALCPLSCETDANVKI